MEFHERVIEAVLIVLVFVGLIAPWTLTLMAVGHLFSWVATLVKRKPVPEKAVVPVESREKETSPEPEAPKSAAPKPGMPEPESPEPTDPRRLLEDWAQCVALDVLCLAAAGEPIAGREFEPPPVAGRLPRRQSPSLLFLLRVPVAGLAYHAYGEEAPRIARGSELFLAREPTNPHDALAIAVHGPGGRRIGYVPRRENAVPARLLDGGLPIRTFVFRHVIAHGTPIVEIALALAQKRREQGVAA